MHPSRVIKKRKVLLCVMGNQQKEGVHFQLGDFCAPVMKAAKVRHFNAIVAKHRLNLFKSDTLQASMYRVGGQCHRGPEARQAR
jgi:hypothetical protein